MKMDINTITLRSVGIDVGSSTSHLVFSNLVLVRDEMSPSHRFKIEQREVVYEGKIIDTPLQDNDTIDISRLIGFVRAECKRADIDPEDIHTGAVIITGETAKKRNAREIVEALSKDTGKFVAATAGPNFESLLAAMGSGATARSKDLNKTILSHFCWRKIAGYRFRWHYPQVGRACKKGHGTYRAEVRRGGSTPESGYGENRVIHGRRANGGDHRPCINGIGKTVDEFHSAGFSV